MGLSHLKMGVSCLTACFSANAVAIDKKNTMFVVSKGDDSAGIWKLTSTGWVLVLNLLDQSKDEVGSATMPDRQPDAEGFTDVSSQPIETVVLAADPQIALWSTFDGSVFSSSLSTDGTATFHSKVKDKIQDLAISTDGRVAAVLEGYRRVTVFQTAKASADDKHEIILTSDARSVALSADGRRLAVGSKDGGISLFDLGQLKTKPLSQIVVGSEVASVTFTPDGKSLIVRGAVIGKDARALAIVDTSNLDDVQYLPMPEATAGAATSVAISQDGKLLAAPDVGGNVLLWDLQERKSIGITSLDSTAISAIGFDEKGSLIAAVSIGDNIVRLITSASDLSKKACDLAGRDLDEAEWDDLQTELPYIPVCRRGSSSLPRTAWGSLYANLTGPASFLGWAEVGARELGDAIVSAFRSMGGRLSDGA